MELFKDYGVEHENHNHYNQKLILGKWFQDNIYILEKESFLLSDCMYFFMSFDDGVIKKSEMDTKTTYLLCPDRSCKLFFDLYKEWCELECPRKDDLVKIVQCVNCLEPIELPGDHFYFCAVTHKCPDGRSPLMFQRMSGRYCLIYERPQS